MSATRSFVMRYIILIYSYVYTETGRARYPIRILPAAAGDRVDFRAYI